MRRFDLKQGEPAILTVTATGCEALQLVVRRRSAGEAITLVEERHDFVKGELRVYEKLPYELLEPGGVLEVDSVLYGRAGAPYTLEVGLGSKSDGGPRTVEKMNGTLLPSRIRGGREAAGVDTRLCRFDLHIAYRAAAAKERPRRDTGAVHADRVYSLPESLDDIAAGADFSLGEAPPAPPAGPPDDPSAKNYPVWYGTNRVPLVVDGTLTGYSGDRDDVVHHGRCIVRIPRSHRIGEVGSPFWKRVLTLSDDRLKLAQLLELQSAAFWDGVAEQLRQARVGHRHAVVFIHGYNVSFEDAAIRAAQIGCDLSIEGAMSFYSWPSRGTLDGYFADEATIQYSAKFITEFLEQMAELADAEKVHVIAHSMGNRAAYEAVREIVDRAQARRRIPFSQFILAAPDVDADYFRQFAAAYARVATRATMYVSDRDKAVWASRVVHGEARVGLAPPIHVVTGIDTVHAGRVDESILGHGYVASAWQLLNDMHQMIHLDAEPEKRSWVKRKPNEDHWVLEGVV